MKEIPTIFRKNGFDFKLLMREGDIGLFRKAKLGLRFESFEVVIIQRHGTFITKGKLIPAAEHLPSSEQWGVKGWTYSDRPSADRKFNQLKGSHQRLQTPSLALMILPSNKTPWSANQCTKKGPSRISGEIPSV
jgi:hypothetical protein